jgi:hypothetical protein
MGNQGSTESHKRKDDLTPKPQKKVTKLEDSDWVTDYDEQQKWISYYNPKMKETSWNRPATTTTGSSITKKENTTTAGESPKLPSHADWKIALDWSTGRILYYHPQTQQPTRQTPFQRLIVENKDPPTRGYILFALPMSN